MTIKQARSLLAKLGFQMNPDGAGNPNYGRKYAEYFIPVVEIKSHPYRDVYISRLEEVINISSHIRFKGVVPGKGVIRPYDCRNIFGRGKTLLEAIVDFEADFNAKMKE